MHCIKKLLTTILWFIPLMAITQEKLNTLGESAYAINHNVSKKYSINLAFRSRYFLYRNATVQYQQQQVDLYHFSTFNLDYSHKLSLGVYYRNRDWYNSGSNELRITQQFNYTKQFLGVRYGHRLRAEQRILETRTIFRQRYRFAVDFPLNGEKLDIGEAYFMANTENLLSLSKLNKPEADLRFSAHIGWQITQNLKLQTGLEHRLEAFNIKAKHNVFLMTSATFKIK